MATTYTLKAIIDPTQVAKFKARGFSLFFGKVINDASGKPIVNVIWNSNSEFIFTNDFEWQENYSIAGAETNTTGDLASATTVIQPIGLGQSVTVDGAGNLGPAQGAVTPGPITFYNNDDNIDFSALLFCTGPNDTTTPAPVYISIPLEAGFNVQLTPIETVAVWFSEYEATSTIIANASNTAYQVTYLKGVGSHTISWLKQASGRWDWETIA